MVNEKMELTTREETIFLQDLLMGCSTDEAAKRKFKDMFAKEGLCLVGFDKIETLDGEDSYILKVSRWPTSAKRTYAL